MKWILIAIGWTSVGVGLVGILLPLLPTTPFMILAAICFSKSSDRFYNWLLSQPVIGPSVYDWNQYGVIRLRAKLMATVFLTGSLVIIFFFVAVILTVKLIAATTILAVAAFIWWQPSQVFSRANLAEAVKLLNSGEVVAIPTETVYGLAARMDNLEAVKKIFAVKERPFFDPLIVHVSHTHQAKNLVKEWNPALDRLAQIFWPGPLTLVSEKSSLVNDLITSGMNTVGLRCPRHPVAQKLLKEIGVPLVAPSANKFGRTSPTREEHVRVELPDIYILKGRNCEVGIESTIVGIRHSKEDGVYQVQLLRPGMIEFSKILKTLQDSHLSVEVGSEAFKGVNPGQLENHYMPQQPLVLLSSSQLKETHLVERVNSLLHTNFTSYNILKLSPQAILAARQLYSQLRQLSSKDQFIVFAKDQEQAGVGWEAIMDRLKKAATVDLTEM